MLVAQTTQPVQKNRLRKKERRERSESSQDEPELEKRKAAEKRQESSNFVSEEDCWDKGKTGETPRLANSGDI